MSDSDSTAVGTEVDMERLVPLLSMMLSVVTNNHRNYWKSVYRQELEALVESQEQDWQARLSGLHSWFGGPGIVAGLNAIAKLSLAKSAPILDLGTGNGIFCMFLTAAGYTNVTGADYCQDAIATARAVQSNPVTVEDEIFSEWLANKPQATFLVDDITASNLNPSHFQLIHDKGCLDDIVLHYQNPDDGEEEEGSTEEPAAPATFPEPSLLVFSNLTATQRYCYTVLDLLAPGGFLVLTSCSHTPEEAEELFSGMLDMADLLETESDENASRLPPNRRVTEPPAGAQATIRNSNSALLALVRGYALRLVGHERACGGGESGDVLCMTFVKAAVGHASEEEGGGREEDVEVVR